MGWRVKPLPREEVFMSIYVHLVKRENILLADCCWGKLIHLLYVRKWMYPFNLKWVPSNSTNSSYLDKNNLTDHRKIVRPKRRTLEEAKDAARSKPWAPHPAKPQQWNQTSQRGDPPEGVSAGNAVSRLTAIWTLSVSAEQCLRSVSSSVRSLPPACKHEMRSHMHNKHTHK